MRRRASASRNTACIWFGFYANAFKMIKAAYASLDRPPAPLATWRDAFKQHDYVALSET
jgi:hypothetical protein